MAVKALRPHLSMGNISFLTDVGIILVGGLLFGQYRRNDLRHDMDMPPVRLIKGHIWHEFRKLLRYRHKKWKENMRCN